MFYLHWYCSVVVFVLSPYVHFITHFPTWCNIQSSSLQVTYFNFSRGVLVDHMDRRHLAATEHLKGARQFGQKMAKEREDRLPPLTDEQRAQLHEYLRLLAEREPDVYPEPNNFRPRK
jgi:hypothetical protein